MGGYGVTATPVTIRQARIAGLRGEIELAVALIRAITDAP
jgi:hypothetical protein